MGQMHSLTACVCWQIIIEIGTSDADKCGVRQSALCVCEFIYQIVLAFVLQLSLVDCFGCVNFGWPMYERWDIFTACDFNFFFPGIRTSARRNAGFCSLDTNSLILIGFWCALRWYFYAPVGEKIQKKMSILSALTCVHHPMSLLRTSGIRNVTNMCLLAYDLEFMDCFHRNRK